MVPQRPMFRILITACLFLFNIHLNFSHFNKKEIEQILGNEHYTNMHFHFPNQINLRCETSKVIIL